ncbi:MAG: PRC-barrel domain-containing protein [Loktanella sp.]|nr:PRC-barrel domain-containing protein [Loktanella sp.]
MTTKTFLTTTALSVLLATSAVAQTADGTAAPMDDTAPMATDGMMDAEVMAPQSLEEMTVGDLTGTDVIDANGDSIGSIRDVIQGAGEAEAVVGIGGFLGIGRYDVALPLSDLNYNPEDRAISVTLTREELEALPEYEAGDIEPLPAETPLSSMIVDDMGTSDAPDAPATDAPMTDAPAADPMDDATMDMDTAPEDTTTNN